MIKMDIRLTIEVQSETAFTLEDAIIHSPVDLTQGDADMIKLVMQGRANALAAEMKKKKRTKGPKKSPAAAGPPKREGPEYITYAQALEVLEAAKKSKLGKTKEEVLSYVKKLLAVWDIERLMLIRKENYITILRNAEAGKMPETPF